jgi:hypothetical protein
MVVFKPVNGWNVPVSAPVSVAPGQVASYSANYTVSAPMLAVNGTGIGIIGTTGTVYELDRNSSLSGGTWVPVSTNTITTTGFNLVLPYPLTNAPTIFYRAVWLGQ